MLAVSNDPLIVIVRDVLSVFVGGNYSGLSLISLISLSCSLTEGYPRKEYKGMLLWRVNYCPLIAY